MASSSSPVHPYRYLALFLAALIGLYLLVFLTGTKEAKPKLGIDLQGGTRVTLTARTPDGSKPTRDALDQALQIISSRVNGLGVSGSEVVIDGDNLVITVPGNDGNEARNLGQTARLFVRPVIGQPIPVEAVNKKPAGAPEPLAVIETSASTEALLATTACGGSRTTSARAGAVRHPETRIVAAMTCRALRIRTDSQDGDHAGCICRGRGPVQNAMLRYDNHSRTNSSMTEPGSGRIRCRKAST